VTDRPILRFGYGLGAPSAGIDSDIFDVIAAWLGCSAAGDFVAAGQIEISLCRRLYCIYSRL